MDSIFFWASKLIWFVLSPDLVLVFFTLSTCMLLGFKAYKKALILLCTVSAFMILITVVPVGHFLLSPLDKRFAIPATLPEKIDGILMLAGCEDIINTAGWNQVEVGDGTERYLAFMHLVRAHPNAKAVFTGGTGELTSRHLKSTLVAEKLLKEQGFDISKIIFESESRNTYENGLLTQKLVKPSEGETWILITSAYHMPRSMGVFSKLGWKVIPYPVDHKTAPDLRFKLSLNFSGNLILLQSALKEWTGLAAYFVTGKTDRFFPG